MGLLLTLTVGAFVVGAAVLAAIGWIAYRAGQSSARGRAPRDPESPGPRSAVAMDSRIVLGPGRGFWFDVVGSPTTKERSARSTEVASLEKRK